MAVQVRPRRPRPAVCHSAASATPWMSRFCARRRSSDEVESIWSTTSTVTRGAPACSLSAARTGLGVEEIRRLEQAIPAPLDPLEREAGRLGVLQHLRDAGTRQPHLRGEVLTGVEGPVR